MTFTPPAALDRSSRCIPLLALALVAALPGAAQAGPPPGAAGLSAAELQDPALPVIPRTAEEAAKVRAVTAPPTDFSAAEPFEAMPAGAATSRKHVNRDAFSQSSANMPFARELDFKLGNGLFRKLWVSSPSSTKASDGLGPYYNSRSCQRCHLKDGRGHIPAPEGTDAEGVANTIFLRVSVPAAPEDLPAGLRAIEGYIATLPDPTYGEQLQDFALPGMTPEYRLGVDWSYETVALSGGETAELRRPTWTAEDLGHGPLAEGAMLSPRIAPQMIGLGLLEAISAEDILANADPEDADGDGISGRANVVWSDRHQRPLLGRFGLKAGKPTVEEQSAAAFAGDIGISTPLHPDGWGECTPAQTECRDAPHGGDPERDGLEADAEAMRLVTFYARNLAVPVRRDWDDPQVLAGKRVFHEAGCAACHTPKFVTQRLEDRPEQSFQLIWPYTDLLLHDMGEGLADHRPEARADGAEWRTPPLWGVGLTQTVSGHTEFLHDGRARDLLEAVLWHGGEAQPARDRVVEMPPADRAALIRFLESL
ncbi:di-heme oxidoredictase family protein [Albimonas sp. CAU 1670]|uniref:di-heme oxidoreductase family protein n=1 Tax=Albimonas sp. CAU 1670 TaxID=3032599 RepID=UPI0023DBBC9C|nr:di-heme oxidoredictase family protein [Albimonas sp. CAU 1670]MDF2232306.1 di-heme oxidoredictase family protein [Albimonas sp. CAU 1670]